MQPDEPEPAKLLAISVGLPRETNWRGQTIQTGIFKSPIEGRVGVGPHGIEGDGQADLSVHGGIDKAVYAYDDSSAQYWRDELGRPELAAGAFGENLTLSGWPEDQVRIGRSVSNRIDELRGQPTPTTLHKARPTIRRPKISEALSREWARRFLFVGPRSGLDRCGG